MVVWTPVLFWVSYRHVFLYFGICTHSAQLSMFHAERRSRNTIIIIILIISQEFIFTVTVQAAADTHCMILCNSLEHENMFITYHFFFSSCYYTFCCITNIILLLMISISLTCLCPYFHIPNFVCV